MFGPCYAERSVLSSFVIIPVTDSTIMELNSNKVANCVVRLIGFTDFLNQ